MRNLSTKLFSDLVYEKLEELNYKQVLTNPTTEDKVNELLELHTPELYAATIDALVNDVNRPEMKDILIPVHYNDNGIFCKGKRGKKRFDYLLKINGDFPYIPDEKYSRYMYNDVYSLADGKVAVSDIYFYDTKEPLYKE